eukprot:COSAG01_NODE_56032_length_321_cov_0.684685_1_plen_88_part_00
MSVRVDLGGRRIIKKNNDVALEVLASDGQVVESKAFDDQQDGSYTVDFSLTASGAYTVGATVNGTAIASSPQVVFFQAEDGIRDSPE